MISGKSFFGTILNGIFLQPLIIHGASLESNDHWSSSKHLGCTFGFFFRAFSACRTFVSSLLQVYGFQVGCCFIDLRYWIQWSLMRARRRRSGIVYWEFFLLPTSLPPLFLLFWFNRYIRSLDATLTNNIGAVRSNPEMISQTLNTCLYFSTLT